MDRPPKQRNTATWVGTGVAIVLFILQEVWPPDPLHPMSLDFLRKAIIIAPWLAAVCLAATALGAAAFVRWRLMNAQPRATIDFRGDIVNALQTRDDKIKEGKELILDQDSEIRKLKRDLHNANQAKANLEAERSRYKIENENMGQNQEMFLRTQADLSKGCQDLNTELAGYRERINLLTAVVPTPIRMGKAPTVSTNGDLFTIGSDDDFFVMIKPDEDRGAVGLKVFIYNHRPDAIVISNIDILTAQSWNGTQYRDGREFNPVHWANETNVSAGCTVGTGIWLMVRTVSNAQLMSGPMSSQPSLLKYPNIQSDTQQWLMSFSVEARTDPLDKAKAPSRLRSIQASVIGIWQVRGNIFTIEAAH